MTTDPVSVNSSDHKMLRSDDTQAHSLRTHAHYAGHAHLSVNGHVTQRSGGTVHQSSGCQIRPAAAAAAAAIGLGIQSASEPACCCCHWSPPSLSLSLTVRVTTTTVESEVQSTGPPGSAGRCRGLVWSRSKTCRTLARTRCF